MKMIVIADEINRKLSYLHLTTIAYNNKFSYYVYFSTFSSRKDYYTCVMCICLYKENEEKEDDVLAIRH